MVAKTTLQRYITRLDDVILSGDTSAAENLQDEILAALDSYIDGLKHGLENYSPLRCIQRVMGETVLLILWISSKMQEHCEAVCKLNLKR